MWNMRDSPRTLKQLSLFDCSVYAPKGEHEVLCAESTSNCSKVDQHEASNNLEVTRLDFEISPALSSISQPLP
jgi:hypothetical protein